MKLLILGGAGMLGHTLWQTAAPRVETWVTLRDDGGWLPDAFDRSHVIPGVHADDIDTVAGAMAEASPDVVVNCLGVVKQHAAASDPVVALTVNSLFPLRAAALCRADGIRFIHISTDCVFAGTRGNYTEEDLPDATDLYGRSKLLGEVNVEGAVTLRTSMIGRELKSSHGLVEWFLARSGTAPGFTRAMFSGLTTTELSRVILHVIESRPSLSGLYHVAAAPTSKYDLLVRLNAAFNRGLTIEKDASIEIDRTLDGRRFAAETGYSAPSWDHMVEELAATARNYDTWRQHAR